MLRHVPDKQLIVMQNVIPREFINFSIQAHYAKFNRKSHAIYVCAILLFMIAFVSIFFINIEIIVLARGIIRSSSEPMQITSPVVAKVAKTSLKENIFVTKGDTLVWFSIEKHNEKIKYFQNLINENKTYLKDIDLLLYTKTGNVQTDLFKAIKAEYQQKITEFELNILILQKSFDRSLSLFEKGVIPLADQEETEYKLKNKIEEKKIFIQLSKNEWLRMAVEYQTANDNYSNEIKLLQKDIQDHYILAPGAGHISHYTGIKRGSYVTTGTILAVISPSDTLITEHLVPPKNIGYLRDGMPVIYQLDSYNYNDWGVATGKIIDISNEIDVMNDQPFFKVYANINETHLSLKNGFKGELKKGLTTTTRFKVTERTLSRLLFDKIDNWLNPAIFNE